MLPKTKVVISGRFLDQPVTGVQRFGRELLNALDKLLQTTESTLEWFLACPTEPRVELKSVRPVLVPGRTSHLWEQKLPLIFTGFHHVGLTNSVPLLAASSSVVVHDAAAFERHMRRSYSRQYLLGSRVMQFLASRRATNLLTVSGFSAGRLEVFTKRKFGVVYPGSDHVPSAASLTPLIDGRKPYWLVIGTSKHKLSDHQNFVIELAAALGRDVKVVGGVSGRTALPIESSSDELQLLGRLTDFELYRYLVNAEALLHVSTYEGFGLPAVEAQRLGVPVVSLASEVNLEVLGSATILIDPDDAVGSQDRLRGLQDGPSRGALIASARENAQRFTWASAALHFKESVEHAVRSDG